MGPRLGAVGGDIWFCESASMSSGLLFALAVSPVSKLPVIPVLVTVTTELNDGGPLLTAAEVAGRSARMLILPAV